MVAAFVFCTLSSDGVMSTRNYMPIAYHAIVKEPSYLKQQVERISCFCALFYWRSLLGTSILLKSKALSKDNLQIQKISFFHSVYSSISFHGLSNTYRTCNSSSADPFFTSHPSDETTKPRENNNPIDIFSKTAFASHTVRISASLTDDCRNIQPDSGVSQKLDAVMGRTGRSFYCCYPKSAMAGGSFTFIHSLAPDGSPKTFHATGKHVRATRKIGFRNRRRC